MLPLAVGLVGWWVSCIDLSWLLASRSSRMTLRASGQVSANALQNDSDGCGFTVCCFGGLIAAEVVAEMILPSQWTQGRSLAWQM